MRIVTWNINSVRLRIDLIEKFVKEHAPDILALQETKCPDDKFPLSKIQKMGFEHVYSDFEHVHSDFEHVHSGFVHVGHDPDVC